MDMLMWTTALQAEEVSCRSDFFGREVDINSAINVKFSNGALGTISIMGSAPIGFWEDFTIIGTKGCIFSRNDKIVWQKDKRGPQLALNSGAPYPELHAAEQLLIESHIPFRTVLPQDLDSIGESLRLLLLPEVNCLIETEAESVRTFVNAGDTGTDPLNADTDGDGVDDGTEVALGTDPNIPDLPLGPWVGLVAGLLMASSGLVVARRQRTS